jgi:hypothetical protein
MSEQNDFPESWHWTPVGRALREIDSADTGPRRSFVILGAGVAGLATALELVRRGHRVEVIEGSDRVGGRVATHRFRNGSYGERGAMRIPLAHDYTHHYIREAKIPQGDLRRFWSSRGNGLVDVRGTVIRESENRRLVELFPGLTEEERRIVTSFGPGGLLGSAMGPLFQRLRPKYAALLAGDFSDPELAALDRISWRSYLETRTGLSEDGRALIGASLSIAAVWEWSLAAILRDEIHQIHPRGQSWTGVLCEIAGGLDRLPRRWPPCCRTPRSGSTPGCSTSARAAAEGPCSWRTRKPASTRRSRSSACSAPCRSRCCAACLSKPSPSPSAPPSRGSATLRPPRCSSTTTAAGGRASATSTAAARSATGRVAGSASRARPTTPRIRCRRPAGRM